MSKLPSKVAVSKMDLRKYPECRTAPWKVDWYDTDNKRHRRFFADRTTALEFQSLTQRSLLFPDSEERGKVAGFSTSVAQYLAQVAGAANTLYQYETILTRFGSVCSWPDSEHWTGSLILRYIHRRRETDKVAPATVNKELRTLKAFFHWAVKPARLIPESPFESLPLHKRSLRESRPDPATWTPAEFQKVLDALPSEEWRVFALLLVNGVGRHNDVAALEISQLDFHEQAIRLVETKTGKSKLAPLHPSAWSALLHYIGGRHTGRIFTQHSFKPEFWKSFCERAGVPHVTMHHLRICLSNWLQDAGTPAETVSRLLNHSSTSVTLGWYTTNRSHDARFRAVSQLPLAGPSSPSPGTGERCEDDSGPDLLDAPLV